MPAALAAADTAARADGGRLELELWRAQVGETSAETASAELRTAGRHETQGFGSADVSAGAAAARGLPREPGIIRRGRPLGAQESGANAAARCRVAGLEADARATHARRPAASRPRRYDCPEKRSDRRRFGG